MAEFCKCGSLVISGRCSNKGCSLKTPDSKVPIKTVRKSAAEKAAKSTKTRRASKCITYNLYEEKSEEGGNN